MLTLDFAAKGEMVEWPPAAGGSAVYGVGRPFPVRFLAGCGSPAVVHIAVHVQPDDQWIVTQVDARAFVALAAGVAATLDKGGA